MDILHHLALGSTCLFPQHVLVRKAQQDQDIVSQVHADSAEWETGEAVLRQLLLFVLVKQQQKQDNTIK